jgi:alanyl-tRNA synthetase
VDGYGIEPGRLHVTVHDGDDESPRTWRQLGLPVEPTRDENWWSNGPTGLCGPDSEIFVWTGSTPPSGTPTTDPRWVEVWNHVSMRYHRHDDGRLEPLRQSNVDTGMGVERMLTVLQGVDSVYDTDLFQPWMSGVGRLWPLEPRQHRIVCDHLRSVEVIVDDGVRPSNTGRGYVLRRLIRRALTTLWRDDPTRTLRDLPQVSDIVLDEERRFRTLVDRGRSAVSRRLSRGPLDEDDFHYLHDTHGLPRDLVIDLVGSLSGPR